MQTQKLLAVACCLAVLGLAVASCAPAAGPTSAGKATVSPAQGETPAAKGALPAAPSATPKPGGDQPKYGGILSVHVNGNAPSFDIQQESTIYTIQPIAPAYNTLVRYDPFKGDLVGDLAEKWDMSPDGKSYTFQLARGVKWHDGRPFTIEDAKYSLDRIRKPPRGTVSPRQMALAGVRDVEAVNDSTLKIVLTEAEAAFMANISTGYEVIMPRHVIESKGNMKKDVVGTGPYKFVRSESGSFTELTKNPDYFRKGLPYLDGIKFFVLSDASTRFAALRTKRIQLTATANGLTASQVEMIKKEKLGISILERDPAKIWRMIIKLDVPPWNDVRVRRAVNLAMDRQAAINIVQEGLGVIGFALPPQDPLAIPDAEVRQWPGFRQPKDADVAEAKKLLAEAGYANGFPARIVSRAGTTFQKAGVFFKDQLDKLGISTTVDEMEAGAYVNNMAQGKFTIAALSVGLSSWEPGAILGETYATGGAQNYGKLSDSQFDTMWQEQRVTLDIAKRKQLILQLQRRAQELVPIVISHWALDPMGMWPEVSGYKPGRTTYDNFQHEGTWLAK